MADPQRPLDAREVQKVLGISSATFYRWLREGQLKGTKVGGRWRFERAFVEALLGASDADRAQELADLGRARALCRQRLPPDFDSKDLDAMDNASLSDAHAVADLLVAHAVARKATDLHIAPAAEGLAVRERVDGVLAEVSPALPGRAGAEIVEALKKKAGLDLAVVDRPQVGQFFADVLGRKVDVRAATFPTWQGESLTLRLADPEGVHLRLGEVGYSESIVAQIMKAISRPHGVFLLNGPSGSGKTTTLYCALVSLYRPGLKVMTVEDPVEAHLDGILQAQVTEGMQHKDAMLAMLRNDLDVGMVSELRDAETIRLLFQMAGTGHMMLSALHAPDAVHALSRLLAVGAVEPRFLVENLRGILDQRLVGKSCRHCRELRPLAKEDSGRLLLPAKARRGKFAYNPGCEVCNQTGQLGRVPVGEFLELSPALVALIEEGETSPEALRAAQPKRTRRFMDDMISKLVARVVSPPVAASVLGL
jgi:excisionase family DNA binding protein